MLDTRLAIAASLCLALVAGSDPSPPHVHVDRLPPVPDPRPVVELQPGTLFRTHAGGDGELWLRVEPVSYQPADPSHVLFGVRDQPARPSWYREQVQLGTDDLNRWHLGLVTSPAAIAALDLPQPVYAVGLDRWPGVLVRMDPETWAWPVADARLTVRER